MKRIVASVVVSATFIVLTGYVNAANRVHIGVPRSTVQSAWGRGSDPCTGSPCTFDFGLDGNAFANVTFDRQSRMNGIQITGINNFIKTPAHWQQLLGFLPPGAAKLSCRDFSQTGGGFGPAHACIYRWHGGRILVAQWFTNNPSTLDGWVNVGYGYNRVKAAS
jgi:hypothetical protein